MKSPEKAVVLGMEERRIFIVGCGPGSLDCVTPEAMQVATQAGALVGARRLLDLFPASRARRVEVSGRVQEVLDEIDALDDPEGIAVLVTGDPGLFSLARLVIERFGRDRCKVIAGISSVQVAFSRLGLEWSDAKIISAHKDDPPPDLLRERADKIAILGGRGGSLKWIYESLPPRRALETRIFVMENLTLPDERIREVTREDLAEMDAATRAIILIIEKSILP